MATPRQGLPRSRRILNAAAYSAVFKHRCTTHDTFFKVFSAPNRLPYARLGLAVSRKVSTRAVVRNRIKRQVREWFRLHHAVLTGLDVVVVSQRAPGEDLASLRTSLRMHWERISQKCKSS